MASSSPDARTPGGLFYAAVAAAAAILGVSWWLFHAWRPPTFILTARNGMLPVPPLYAYFLPEPTRWTFLAAAVLAGGVFAWTRIRWRGTAAFLLFAAPFALAFRLAVHATALPELPGKEILLWAGDDIYTDADRVDSIARFLGDYTRVQPFLSLHGQHHPPGYAILHALIRIVVGPDVHRVGTLLTCLASLVVLPAYFLSRRLRGRPEDGRTAAMLVAVLPGMTSYGAASLDAVYAVLATAVLAALWRDLDAPSHALRAGIGLLLWVAMMLSYSTFVLGLLCVLVVVLHDWRRPRVLAARASTIGAAFLLPFPLLYAATGFDALECFANARVLNTHLMTRLTRQDLASLPVWSYASIGNLLAFLIDLGAPVVAGLALLAGRRLARREAILAAATAATLAAACFGGIYFMETERIFLFLVPAVAAIAVLPERFRPGAAVLLSGAQAILMEVLLYTLW